MLIYGWGFHIGYGYQGGQRNDLSTKGEWVKTECIYAKNLKM